MASTVLLLGSLGPQGLFRLLQLLGLFRLLRLLGLFRLLRLLGS
jgi:hypothetical protein